MTAPRPKGTKRADRRALVDAGKRYHAAKLAYGYEPIVILEEFEAARKALVHAAEVYVVGQRKASVAFAHKHYKKSKKAAT